MGYFNHHAIVVIGHERDVDHVHALAKSLGAGVSEIVDGKVNGYRSFLVAPDGSKEGWGESDQGDTKRTVIIEALRGVEYLTWAEVSFPEDGPATVIDCNNEDDEDEDT